MSNTSQVGAAWDPRWGGGILIGRLAASHRLPQCSSVLFWILIGSIAGEALQSKEKKSKLVLENNFKEFIERED